MMTRGQARGQGRPLRFLLVVMLCWSGARLAPSLDFGEARPSRADIASMAPPVPSMAPAYRKQYPGPRPAVAVALRHMRPPIAPYGRRLQRHTAPTATPTATGANGMPAFPGLFLAAEAHGYADSNGPVSMDRGSAREGASALASFPPGFGFAKRAKSGTSDRWQLSAWALWRPGMNGNANAGTGRLGASQIGLRLDRELLVGGADGGRLTAYARLSRALVRPASPEAAIGIAVQPARALPFTVGVERRIALGTGGRNAMAIVGAAGIGPVALPGKIALDGYAQAGMVGANRRDAFGDGRLSLLLPAGNGRIAFGLGLSGGAQPQVSRLDFGPEVRAKLAVAGGTVRLDAGWRARIAGNARPGSGPAITLAGNF